MKKDLCIIYFGRTAGHPQFIKLWTEETLKQNQIEKFNIIISKENNLKDEIVNIKKDSFLLHTPITNKDVILRFFPFVFNFTKIILKNRNKNYIFSMTHIYNSIAMILIKIFIRKSNIMYICHDAIPHPGEKNIKLQKIISKIEIFFSDKVITLSENVNSIFRKIYPKKNTINIFHPTFTIKKQSYIVKTLSPVPTFLFFGRIIEYKGLDMFIKSVNIFLESNQEKIKIIIAGNGEIKKETLKLINEVNDKYNNIELINRYINENEVDGIWNRSDVCVLPYIEASQSGVIGVAISNAMPCIYTPIPGLIEQIDISTGEVGVPSKDITADSFAKTMKEILNKDTYTTLSENAIRHQKDISWEKFVLKIYELLK